MQPILKFLTVSALGFVSTSAFGETAALASLDLLSDASAFVADEANVDTSEARPDNFAASTSDGAEINLDIKAQSVSNHAPKVP